jgi:hypothetical protein
MRAGSLKMSIASPGHLPIVGYYSNPTSNAPPARKNAQFQVCMRMSGMTIQLAGLATR